MRRRWIVAAGLVLTAATVAYQSHPGPRIWLLRRLSGDGSDPMTAAARLAPSDIEARVDVRYAHSRPDCRLDVYRPAATAARLPVVVWVHGGGFVTGSKEPLRPYLSVLASHGFAAVNVEYTKAPQAQHPTQIHQLRRAITFIRDHADELGLDPGQLFLAGDSAGAHIVAQTALAAGDPGYAAGAGITETLESGAIAGVMLASGPHDLAAAYALPGPFAWYLRSILWAYTGNRRFNTDPRYRHASIVENVTAAFPPTFISSGPQDPLAVQSRTLARRLHEVGAYVDEVRLPASAQAGHVFDFDLASADARYTLERRIAFLRQFTHGPKHDGVTDRW